VNQAPDLPTGDGWRNWLSHSTAALRINQGFAVESGLGLAIAFAVIVVTWLTDRPISGVGDLLIPGFPLLLLCQLWVIAILYARIPRPRGSWWDQMSTSIDVQRSPRRFLFGALPGWAAYLLIAAIVSGWFSAMAAFPGLLQGNPGDGYAGCPWPLVNHGAVTCVSYARYEDADAAGERFAAGILMFFFAMHFGVVIDEMRRRTR